MRGTELRAIVFDFHQTLFRFEDSPSWLTKASAGIGRPPSRAQAAAIWARVEETRRDPEVVRRQQGRDLSAEAHREAVGMWLSRAGLDPDLIDAMYAVLCEPASWSPYPDVAPVLAELGRRGVPVAVLSNIGWDIRPTFRHHGIGQRISAFVLSCEQAREKPDPDLFRLACTYLGTDPAGVLMVGDDPRTDGGAVFAGMPVFLLPAQAQPRHARGLAPVLDLFEVPRSARPT